MQVRDYEKNDLLRFGRVELIDLPMHSYPDERRRTVRVWLPPSYDGQRRFPVLYLHDGQNLFDGIDGLYGCWYMDRSMQALDAEGLSAILVGVDNSLERMGELCPPGQRLKSCERLLDEAGNEIEATGELYARFVTEQLKPLIDSRYAALSDKAHTGIGGSSMGGLLSAYMALSRPDVYGRCLSFSPAFGLFGKRALTKALSSCAVEKLTDSRFFFYAGGAGFEAGFTEYALAADLLLRKKGVCSAALIDTRLPHHESAWAKYFPEAFRFLFS